MAISSGAHHACAIRTNGSVECWGSNSNGQSRPEDGTFVSISLGDYYSCGITSRGEIKCWGYEAHLGESPPTGEYTALTTGTLHACAINTEAQVKCWGQDYAEQASPPDTKMLAVSAGAEHSCGLMLDGRIECWGSNKEGQLSHPSGRFVELRSGPFRICGLRENGRVECWGNDQSGLSSPRSDLIAVGLGMGWHHSCGVLTNGSIRCWGSNEYGQTNLSVSIIDATPTPRPRPRPTPTPPSTRSTPQPTPTYTPVPPNRGEPSPSTLIELVEEASDSVVKVIANIGTGSGWIYRTVGEEAWVLTNQHVVDNDRTPNVHVEVMNKTYRGDVVGSDINKDLAVVRICCSSRFRSLPFGRSGALRLAEGVIALGYPAGTESVTFNEGKVSSREQYQSTNRRYIITTDVPANPGNSGGPLLNLQGEVVGIVSEREEPLYDASGRPIVGLSFAVAERTISESLRTLERGRFSAAAATPTPAPMPTPGFRSSYSNDRFGPENGELHHDPNGALITTSNTDTDVSNFFTSVTVVNPYGASTADWDFCLAFRDEEQRDRTLHLLTFRSDRRYTHTLRDRGESNTISQGEVRALRRGNGAENSVSMIVIQNRGYVFVNREFVTDLDLRDHNARGTVWLGTGCTEGFERQGAVTRFKDLYVQELESSYSSSRGTLTNVAGFIAQDYTDLHISSGYVRATFENPNANEWSYGFIFRNSGDSNFYSAIIDNYSRPRWRGQWNITWRPGSVEDEVEIDSGGDSSISTIRGQTNMVELLYVGRFGALYVDNELRSTFSLEDSQDAGDISIAGWFYSDEPEGKDIEYSDFEVWSLD